MRGMTRILVGAAMVIGLGNGSGVISEALVSPTLSNQSPSSQTEVVTNNTAGNGTAGFNAELFAVPEPASMALFGTGLVMIATLARRLLRKRHA